jgi:hypothetical protein
MAIDKFPQTVAEKLGFYVYVYLDPSTNEIFYIGKGKDNRCFSHLNDMNDNEKNQRIKKIRALGLEPKIEVLAFGLDEGAALRVEAAAIDLVGIKNLTNLQRGHNSDALGRKTLDDLIALFHAQSVKHFEENIVLIRVNQSYRSGMPPSELYEITRGIWKISDSRRNSLQFACAVYAGVVREVYKIERWFPAGSTYYSHRIDISTRLDSGRFEFVGNIAPDSVRKKYSYKSVAYFFRNGNISPLVFVGPCHNRNSVTSVYKAPFSARA